MFPSHDPGVVSPEHSYTHNKGKEYPRRFTTVELTEKQYKYGLTRLDREITIPSRYKLGKTINAKDWCVFLKKEDFSFDSFDLGVEKNEVIKTDSEKMKEDLRDEQAKRNGKNKK